MCWLQVTDQTPKELFRVICLKCNGPGGQGEADLYEYKRMMALRYPEQYYFTNDQEEREAAAQAFLPKFLEQQAAVARKRIHSADRSSWAHLRAGPRATRPAGGACRGSEQPSGATAHPREVPGNGVAPSFQLHLAADTAGGLVTAKPREQR